MPSLKDLYIKGMSAIKTIGHELYGEGCSCPFTNLEALSLVDMQEWEDWTTSEVELPRLSKLCIKNCPRLSATLPKHLSSLKKLEIVDCPLLVVSIPRLPALSELEISNWKEANCLHEFDSSSLNSLKLSKIPVMKSAFKEKVIQGIKQVQELFLTEGANYEHFSYLHMSRSFQRRWVFDFLPQLTSFMVDEEEEQTQQVFAHSNLAALHLLGLQCLEKLPEWIFNVKSLAHLTVTNCPRLVSFPKAPTLKRLIIMNCPALQSLLENGTTSAIEALVIWRCPSLTTLQVRGDLHSTLKELRIGECSGLPYISSGGKLPVGLEILSIHSCPKLESIAERFDDNMKSLRDIMIRGCPNLENFPYRLHNLTSLQSLAVADCPNISSFLGEGFPTNLTRLWISHLNIIKPAFEWGLHRLAHLQDLSIGRYPGTVCFPSEEMRMRLPRSLTELTIEGFPDLKCLSTRGFQDLGARTYFTIENCPKLSSIPTNCLPPSLLNLQISGCRLLKQSCHKGNKQQWFHISHIPNVEMDAHSVFDPEYRPLPQQGSCIPCLGHDPLMLSDEIEDYLE